MRQAVCCLQNLLERPLSEDCCAWRNDGGAEQVKHENEDKN